MSYYYKLIISYDGSQYCGWQRQKDNANSIEETILMALWTILGHKEVKLSGASRTDGGVHAQGQVAKLTTTEELEASKFLPKFNARLPSEIKIKELKSIDSAFNANLDAKSKEYHYYFSPDATPSAHLATSIYSVPHKLNIDLMQEACKCLTGEHDFKSFGNLRADATNAKRTIHSCEIVQTSFGEFLSTVYIFKIKGDGFLKYMVRKIMASLIEIGQEKINLQEFREALKKETHLTTHKAPAHGLYLYKIDY